MKTLLAILLSFIVSEAPVFAIHGGYSLAGAQSVVGTYAGVLVPSSVNILSSGETDFGTNSLGIFTLSVPSKGIGAGVVILFSDGSTYTGAITALPDPNNSSGVLGVLSATYNYNLYTTVSSSNGTTVATEAVTATAQGSFNAAQVTNAASSGGLGVDLDGTSVLNIDQGFVSGSNGVPIITEQITYDIEGYQQSTTATQTSGSF